jgi:hypothetical protein
MPEGLAPVRRSIRPQTGDTFESVAARELADVPTDDAVASLREWNTHLTRFARGPRPLLVSDIIYVEAAPDGTGGDMLSG